MERTSKLIHGPLTRLWLHDVASRPCDPTADMLAVQSEVRNLEQAYNRAITRLAKLLGESVDDIDRRYLGATRELSMVQEII